MRRSPCSSRPGFTLVEILMVLAIMGIMTVVAMPSLVKSIRGNRLRVGTRTLVMASNYARTSAILRSQEMKLTLDKANNSVSVDPLRSTSQAPAEEGVFRTEPAAPSTGSVPDPDSTEEPPVSAAPFASLTRKLDPDEKSPSERKVWYESYSVDGKRGGTKDDTATIIFQSNGRCTPFEARIADEFGGRMIVSVDAVASVKVTKEGD